MAQGIFYVLDGLSPTQQLQLICQQISERWREFRSVRVYCQNQQQAEQIDQLLWQQPEDAFVPHNLCGEGPPQGAPVELCWPECNAPSRRTAAVVNLQQLAAPIQGARMVIDWVPVEDSERQQARERYKHYRSQRLDLTTVQASELLSNQH